ncbi:uncharacterized protein CTHT_0001450 [Thermochaetoides thermophila DSM 1495]|uniref:Uncharacterized protein n=1 Tax=Chaetomium thermophilum (strain DSM 1495 / CBS 144.50 / IMI 039719) TaxID=759272 RepID=G0RZ24_CHATD|nr:hypothetical protein CTHT_0001450 [Thermochaetoides thermophila DSM 1495]EGS23452.1 hypothetical protein CTHT_0001450 [Thermochaetoides thermophila DSM 1495]
MRPIHYEIYERPQSSSDNSSSEDDIPTTLAPHALPEAILVHINCFNLYRLCSHALRKSKLVPDKTEADSLDRLWTEEGEYERDVKRIDPREILCWERKMGMEQRMDVEKQRGRWPWMRITVDLIGIRRIERLGERPRYHGEDTEENGLQYGYAMVNVDELKGVIAEVKHKRLRLRLPRGLPSQPPTGFYIWNTECPPLISECRIYGGWKSDPDCNGLRRWFGPYDPYNSRMLKATRLDHPSIRGITFFLDRVDARPLGMHVHWKNHCEQCIYLYDQSNDNGPGDAEMAIFPGKTSVEWYPLYFYVPIGKDDKIVGFGILRTKEPILHGTELATKMVPHALMVRLEHAGDIIASQNHLVNKPMETFDWCLAQSRGSGPVALVYGVPHYGCLIWEWFGGYDGTNPEKHCRFEPKFELPPSLKHRGLNFSDCDDAIYTWAPLDGLESATEYHDGLPKYGYGSSGILLRYNDGSQRTVGLGISAG